MECGPGVLQLTRHGPYDDALGRGAVAVPNDPLEREIEGAACASLWDRSKINRVEGPEGEQCKTENRSGTGPVPSMGILLGRRWCHSRPAPLYARA